jgi:RHS repeat-associated protein
MSSAESELDNAEQLLSQVLTVTSITELIGLKGFTAHEALADVGLVHMNARLYDPELGRFASPDSMIPEPGNAMAYNRYSYVKNNPTLAADPSGHSAMLAYAAFTYVFVQGHSDNKYLQIASAVWLAVASGDVFSGGGAAGAVMTQGGLSLVTGYLQSGTLGTTEVRSAILSGAAAGLAAEIGHPTGDGVNSGPQITSWQTKAVYHGLAQGSIGWLRNKDFWSGFVAGTVGHGVGHSLDASGIESMYQRAAIASGSAAIAAKATGGDAAAAALSAVIVHLYNMEGAKEEIEAKQVLKRIRSLDMGDDGDRAILAGYSLFFKQISSRKAGTPIVNNRNFAAIEYQQLQKMLLNLSFPEFSVNVTKYVNEFYFDSLTGQFGLGLPLKGLGGLAGIGGAAFNGRNDIESLRGAAALQASNYTSAMNAIEGESLRWYAENIR